MVVGDPLHDATTMGPLIDAKAAELGERPGWTELNQYANPANPEGLSRRSLPG